MFAFPSFKFDKITVLMITTWWLTIFDTTATNMITNYMILNQRVLHNHAYNYNIVLETWFRVVLGQNFCGWNNNSSNLDIINLLFRCANKWIKYSYLNLISIKNYLLCLGAKCNWLSCITTRCWGNWFSSSEIIWYWISKVSFRLLIIIFQTIHFLCIWTY